MASTHYTLYGRPNAGSLAPQIVLEEIGAPYELVWVGTEAAQIERFRHINPSGRVPCLGLPDGTAVPESAAILIHLTLAHPEAGLAPPPGSTAHARFLSWMVFLSANLYETALRYYYAERYSSSAADGAPAIQAQARADYRRWLAQAHEALDPYLLGSVFSAADPYLYMLAGWYPEGLEALGATLPRLARHAELLRRRAATRTADARHAGA